MSITVILDVFSGRENPRWTLSGAQEEDLARRLSRITTPTLSKPVSVTGLLGYRGFVLSRPRTHPRGGLRLLIHQGIVDFGQTEENRIARDRSLEQWLLTTAPGLPPAIDNHVDASINTVVDFEALLATRAAEAACPACQAADAPTYAPTNWNVPNVQPFNNCYNYANDQVTNTFAQPGRAHSSPAATMACADVQTAASRDGLVSVADPSQVLAGGQGWYVALVIWPGADYHWYRQDRSGCWSHKPGQTAVRDADNSGNRITDPATCDRGPYSAFCGYMITRQGVVIA